MTPKERIQTLNLSRWMDKNDAIKLEHTVDFFAIGFAYWLFTEGKKFHGYKIKHLLEIYKKTL